MRATSPKGKTKTKSKRSKEVSRPERNRSRLRKVSRDVRHVMPNLNIFPGLVQLTMIF